MTKPSPHPFFIGVAGGSGSGKTTVVKNLLKVLADHGVSHITHDNYYHNQSHMPLSERVKTNYDHPMSLETGLLISHLKQLGRGKCVEIPTYDFVNHTRGNEVVKIEPTPVVIIEGILLYESKELRDLLNLKVFVDTDGDIRFIRRLKRDMEERGRTMESVVNQYMTTVRPMHIEFVEPSKKYADIIIPEGGENQVALDLLLARVHEILQEK